MKIGWDETVRYVFYATTAFLANRATNTFDKLQSDVSELNTKFAIAAVENNARNVRIEWRIDGMEVRVTEVEKEIGIRKKHN